jgi:hypothetical protein
MRRLSWVQRRLIWGLIGALILTRTLLKCRIPNRRSASGPLDRIPPSRSTNPSDAG